MHLSRINARLIIILITSSCYTADPIYNFLDEGNLNLDNLKFVSIDRFKRDIPANASTVAVNSLSATNATSNASTSAVSNASAAHFTLTTIITAASTTPLISTAASTTHLISTTASTTPLINTASSIHTASRGSQTTSQAEIITTSPASPPSTTNQQTVTDKYGSTLLPRFETGDNHEYYATTYIPFGTSYWKDLLMLPVTKLPSLQGAHRLAVRVNIGFDFLFYGSRVRSIAVASGGFLYMSDFLHSFLTATQYVAPLMANFDTSLGNDSEILYYADGKSFTVQWNGLYLQDQQDYGAYTFQVQLYDTGKIVMVFKEVPVPVNSISALEHPVKVGLSDAFYIDSGIYRTIYPYHVIECDHAKVESGSAIVFDHLMTCSMLTTCEDCLFVKLPNFNCNWCSALNRCSSEFSRQRQEWLENSCPTEVGQTNCKEMAPSSSRPDMNSKIMAAKGANSQTGRYIGVGFAAFIIVVALAILVFVIYGYKNPESSAGQFLIRNRPSELARKLKQWRRSEEDIANHYRVNMHSLPN